MSESSGVSSAISKFSESLWWNIQCTAQFVQTRRTSQISLCLPEQFATAKMKYQTNLDTTPACIFCQELFWFLKDDDWAKTVDAFTLTPCCHATNDNYRQTSIDVFLLTATKSRYSCCRVEFKMSKFGTCGGNERMHTDIRKLIIITPPKNSVIEWGSYLT